MLCIFPLKKNFELNTSVSLFCLQTCVCAQIYILPDKMPAKHDFLCLFGTYSFHRNSHGLVSNR